MIITTRGIGMFGAAIGVCIAASTKSTWPHASGANLRMPHLFAPIAAHFPRFSRWIATWGWAPLMLAALATEEAHEYAIAFALAVLAGVSFVATVIHWEGINEHPRLTIGIRATGAAIGLVITTIACLWVFGQKGDQHWSRLPEYLHIMQSRPATAASPEEHGAIASLTSLGWNVKTDRNGLAFEIANKQLPDMKRSAEYFRAVAQPFAIRLQGVPSVSGMSSLAGISSLREVAISASDLTDLSELGSLTGLRTLGITQVPFEKAGTIDISPLASLKKLEVLALGMSRPRDIEALRGLSKLKTLYLNQCLLVHDLSPVENLHDLQTVDVHGTRISDLSALRDDEALQELYIDEKQANVAGTLALLPNLSTLEIDSQTSVDLSSVRLISSVRSLSIVGPLIVDVWPLKPMPHLSDVRILGFGMGQLTHIANAEALGDIQHLERLSLTNVDVASLHFLRTCRELGELNLARLPISSIDALSEVPSLQKVSLADVQVADISPLLKLPNLRALSLLRTPARLDVVEELAREGVEVSSH